MQKPKDNYNLIREKVFDALKEKIHAKWSKILGKAANIEHCKTGYGNFSKNFQSATRFKLFSISKLSSILGHKFPIEF